MATTIKLKNSVTTTAVPSSLVQGEVATNVTDKKLWVGNAASSPVQLLGAGATVSGTDVNYTGTLTGGTGVVNLGSGQFYKDASGNVGIGVSSTAYPLAVQRNATQIWTDCQAAYLEQSLASSSGANIDWYQSTKGTGSFIWRQNSTTERMRIDSSGNLLVGNTSATATPASGFTSLINSGSSYYNIGHINGTGSGTGYIQFLYNSGLIGSIAQSGTTSVAYNTSSDYRLKENIAPMTGALDVVQQLKPVTYNWKSDGSSGQGFIAHELQAVVPDCVTGEKDATRIEQYEITPAIPATFDEEGNELTPAVEAVMGEREVPVYQGIDTSFLVATLTAAIQELKAEFDAYKATHP